MTPIDGALRARLVDVWAREIAAGVAAVIRDHLQASEVIDLRDRVEADQLVLSDGS